MGALSDIAALARAGYKPAEVKDLLAAAGQTDKTTDEPETHPETKQDKTKDNTDTKADEPDTSKGNHPEVTDKSTDDTPSTDFKSLYEATKKKLEEAQAANKKGKGEEPEKTPEQIVDDYFSALNI